MRRGREAKGEERMMLVSLHQWWLALNAVFKEKRLTLWTFLCFYPANKSIVSSSISSECTFFQTVDDHVTHPVLFIPETHISSLQRMVGSALRNSSLLKSWVSPDLCVPAGMRWALGGVGKYFVGKVGWEREDMVSADFKQQRWVKWSRNQAQVRAASATDSEL